MLLGHASGVAGIAFDPTSPTLLSAGADRLLLRWDRSGSRQFAPLRATSTPPRTSAPFSEFDDFAAVSPDGTAVVLRPPRDRPRGSPQTHIQVLDVARRRISEPVDTGHGRLASVSWHPDGHNFVTAGPDAQVRVWDPRTVSVIDERRTVVLGGGIAHLGTGDQIAIIAEDGPVELIDADTLEQVDTPFALPDLPHAIPVPDRETNRTAGHQLDFERVGWLASTDGRTAATLVSANPRLDDGVTATEVTLPSDELVLVDVIDQTIRSRIELGFEAERGIVSPDGERSSWSAVVDRSR